MPSSFSPSLPFSVMKMTATRLFFPFTYSNFRRTSM